jgi:hypothetical protein
MPNQRKKGKKLVAGWLENGDAEEFKQRAEQLGMTATDLLTLLIREELRRSAAARKGRSVEDGNGDV